MPGRSKSQIDQLGDRLRRGGTADDRRQLQMLLLEHQPAMADAQRALDGIEISSTARLKTARSTVEKLQRQTIRLSQVQDLAGLRIIVDGTRIDQDELEQEIRKVVAVVDRDDRRSKPQFGYRALHLVARVDGYRLEIQLRTRMQHGWAEAYEKLADVVGREIRYGGSPGTPAAEGVVQRLQALSDLIARVEGQQGSVGRHLRGAGTRQQELRAARPALNKAKRRRQGAALKRVEIEQHRLTALGKELSTMEAGILDLLGDLNRFVKESTSDGPAVD